MSESKTETGRQAARHAALRWFTRVHSGDLTAADHLSFQAWHAASSANAQAYDELSGVWSALDHVPDPRAAFARSQRPPILSRRRAMAGGLAAAGLAASAAIIGETGVIDALTSDYHTGKGELRSVTLADSSRVDLDADSALSVSFTATERNLTLHRGRAMFTVARDSSRPFSVTAANGTTMSSDAQFIIDRLPDRVRVAVTQNAADAHVGASSALIGAGQTLAYDRRGLGPVHRSEDNAETAWLRGQLVFEDQPLGEVVSAVNRYRSGTILILSDKLLNFRISGVFDVRAPDQVLSAIQETLPVRSLGLTRYLVLLRPA